MLESKMLTLDKLRSYDREDPLALFRNDFDLSSDIVYLDGNSLGPLSKGVADRLARSIKEEWGERLIRGWVDCGWIDLPQKVGDKIGRLIGGGVGNVVAADTTSINLYKLVSAALALRPGRKVILSDSGNFPSELYIIQGLIGQMGDSHVLKLEEMHDIEAAIDENVAVLVLTEVNYRTGRRYDMKAVTAKAHAAGALVLWDLCHSAGAFPVDLLGANADLAVGCGYKYLNGGPGAPAYLFVHPCLQDQIRPVVSGWMGHEQPFAFDLNYKPAKGIIRNVAGTPHVLGLIVLDTALDLLLKADLTKVYEKSLRLGDLFMELVEGWLGEYGFIAVTPKEWAIRGSQVSFRHPEGYAIMKALIAKGVIGDFRAPDIIRFGFTPLCTSYEDIWRAVSILKSIMEREVWRNPAFSRREKVT
jgi:kynureninase